MSRKPSFAIKFIRAADETDLPMVLGWTEPLS